LEEIHATFKLLHTLINLRDLVNTEKTETLSMTEYMAKIQGLNRKLAKGNIHFSDKHIAMFFLLGLPLEKCNGLVRSLKDEENLTSWKVKAKLLLEEKRMVRHEEEVKALAINRRKHHLKHQQKEIGNRFEYEKADIKTQKKPTEDIRCYNCSGRNHIAKYCKKPLRQRDDLRPKTVDRKPRIENELRHAENAVAREFKALCMTRQANYAYKRDEWLVDRGATHHMSRVWKFCTNSANILAKQMWQMEDHC
jgi:hypothetical protein